MMEPLSVLVLAGGRSTRMGQDKAWLEFDGVPLVELVATRLLPLAAEILFSTNEPERFAELLVRLPVRAVAVPDQFPGAGPLAGLHAGLSAATSPIVLTVATDMPFVSKRLVEMMLANCRDADAVVPVVTPAGFDAPQPEPLHALYRKSCLPLVESALRAGRRRAIAFFDDVEVCYLGEAELRRVDPELWSFRNANTPEEFAAARRDYKAQPR